MSLPPETMKVISDIFAAVGSLLYLFGGYSLGKWQSDESQIVLYGEMKNMLLWVLRLETTHSRVYERYVREALEQGEKPPPIPYVDMERMMNTEKHAMGFRLEWMRRSAKHSMWIGFACVLVGTALFLARLML